MYVSIVAPPSVEGNVGKNLTVIDTMGFGLVLHFQIQVFIISQIPWQCMT